MAQSRNTRQKEIIENTVKNFNHLFDVEELFLKAKAKDNKISLATIYRFLKEYKSRGKINEYLCNKRKIYGNEKSHCHFKCKSCGRVTHFSASSLDFLKKNELGSIENFQIDVQGICNSCKQQA